MRKYYYFFLFVLLVSYATLSQASSTPLELSSLNPDVQQVIVVKTANRVDSQVTVTAWERTNGSWTEKISSFKAIIGRNGIAPFGEKVEGDGRTPSGIFKLSRSFGYAPQISTGLNYRQAAAEDFWIDDIDSSQYNQWIHGETPAVSHEKMHRDDNLYRYGIVIEYNTNPIVVGKGSAIFMHIWRDEDKPTAGCVAMEEKNIVKLLKWLDKTKNPVVILK